MRHFGRAIAVAWMIAGPAGPALGGAWTRAEGDGQLITATGRTVAPIGAWTGGPTTEDSSYTSIYVEYGWTDDLTLGGTLFIAIDALYPTESAASAGLFTRYKVWTGEHGDVASVQVGFSVPFEEYVLEEFALTGTSDNVFAIELRGLYGKGWGFDWGNAFISTELGYRWRDGEADEIRFDATTGIEPIHGVLGLMSLYSQVPLGGGRGDAALKVAPSVAWTMFPWVGSHGKKPRGPISPDSVQFGVIYDLLDRSAGLTLQIGVWRAF